jgi:hypothetical protein
MTLTRREHDCARTHRVSSRHHLPLTHNGGWWTVAVKFGMLVGYREVFGETVVSNP